MSLLSGELMASGRSAAVSRRANYAAGASMGKGCLLVLGEGPWCLLRSTAKNRQKPESSGAFSGFAVTVAAAPAGRGLQRGDIRAVVAKNGAGAFEAYLFFVGNAGKQIEPVLKTFHDGDSCELLVTVFINSI